MSRGKMIFVSVVLSSLLFTTAAFSAEKAAESWTGFIFRNGNTAKIDEGGPFKTKEECFAWAKGGLRGTDEFRCGLNCRKDSMGRPTCNRVEKDAPPAPVVSAAEPAAGSTGKKQAEEAAGKLGAASEKKSGEEADQTSENAGKTDTAAAAGSGQVKKTEAQSAAKPAVLDSSQAAKSVKSSAKKKMPAKKSKNTALAAKKKESSAAKKKVLVS